MKSLKFEDGQSKFKSGKSSAQRAEAAQQKSQDHDIGLEYKKTRGGSRKGASKGGQINKKTQAVFDLTGANIANMDAGLGASLDASQKL